MSMTGAGLVMELMPVRNPKLTTELARELLQLTW
jgi:hypothetical protein